MLNSMTGFARETAETPFGTLTCELRAVNHRFLDVQFRMPDELRAKEIELRASIGEVLKRGKVECSLHIRRGGTGTTELALNNALVGQIAARVGEIAALLPEASAPNPVDVLRWPGVVAEPEIDTEPLYDAAAALVGKALDALVAMRASEGERIGQLIESRLDEVVRIASAVRVRMPEVLAAVRARQQERIDKLDVAADPARLETAIALLAPHLAHWLSGSHTYVVEFKILAVVALTHGVVGILSLIQEALQRFHMRAV